MGWNDHLADPDAWEAHAEALRGRADDDRKRAKENAAPSDHDQQRDRYSPQGEAAEAGVTPGEASRAAAHSSEVEGAAE